MVGHSPSMCKAVGSIPRTARKKGKKRRYNIFHNIHGMRFLNEDLFFNMYECFPCTHVCVPCVHRSQKRVLAPLELELQVVHRWL